MMIDDELKFKGSDGEWSYTNQSKPVIKNGNIIGCYQAQVWDKDGYNLMTIKPTKDESVATANARIASASKELLFALQKLLKCVDEEGWCNDYPEQENARKAIEKALSEELTNDE